MDDKAGIDQLDSALRDRPELLLEVGDVIEYLDDSGRKRYMRTIFVFDRAEHADHLDSTV